MTTSEASPPEVRRAVPPADVVCVGETMVMAAPRVPLPLDHPNLELVLRAGGAESNVAVSLAHFGHRVHWWSRLGADPFGDRVLRLLQERGLRTTGVVRDPHRPTGIYFKDTHRAPASVFYYRTGSAASVMSPRDIARLPDRSDLLHVTGITAALSRSAADLLDELVLHRAHRTAHVSFDVNFRPGLWSATVAAPRLLALAAAADTVLVGQDEARALWGTATPTAVRELLPHVPALLVKDAEHGVTRFDATGATFVASPVVDVVEAIGAGDAFAAGYLAGILSAMPPTTSLALGHLLAAKTLGVMGDVAELPAIEELTADARALSTSAPG